MSFTLSMRGQHHITTYEQAVACFDSAIERKSSHGGHAGTHKLSKSPSGITGVSKLGEEIAFTYHATDVVTWSPWGVVLDLSYQSQSTVVFANRFTPDSVRVLNEGKMIQITSDSETRFYLTRPSIRLSPNGSLMFPEQDTRSIQRVRVDRKAANAAAKKYNLAEFTTYYSAARGMLGEGQVHMGSQYAPGTLQRDDIATALLDKAHWVRIVQSGVFGYRAAEKYVLNTIRDAIYEAEGCYFTEVHPYTTRYQDIVNWGDEK